MTQDAIHRGDIWMVNWPRGQGSEQRGVRPSVVIQNDAGNSHGRTTIIAAISTSPRQLPVIVPIGTEGGLAFNSFVNLSQIQTVDRSRLLRRIGVLSASTMQSIDEAIEISLGLVPLQP